jgi:hypothetical protein
MITGVSLWLLISLGFTHRGYREDMIAQTRTVETFVTQDECERVRKLLASAGPADLPRLWCIQATVARSK